MSYLPIGDYGVIGDLHTAALVGRTGSIDWCCAPRFDSPSVFGAILDARRGGRCAVTPTAPAVSEQRYLPETNVLVSTFMPHAGGAVQVTDFMPVGPARDGRAEIHRRIRCLRGAAEVEVVFEPRFDYGLKVPALTCRRHGVLATDADDDVATIATAPGVSWSVEEGRATARIPLQADQTVWLVLRFDDDEVHPVEHYRSQEKLDATIQWWDGWCSRITYQGPYRQEVERSALLLKLCCYEPSGAILAAPTTSLPEWLTASRNWDYRFTWLRDSAFVLYALDALGYDAEADGFMRFLKRVGRRADARYFQIMYAVDGRRELPERILEHLEGYQGASPVRVGNSAAGQFQLDVYGDMLETGNVWRQRHPMTEGTWKVLRDLVDWTAGHWRGPDSGIWEPRSAQKQYVHSKVMAWVALDRGARIATELNLPGDPERWRREADAVHAEVLERGWDPARQTFVQAYGDPQLDAALLVIPKVRFLPRSDPRVRSTLGAIRKELATVCEDLIYRYRTPDGVSGDEGAFVVCSFWMVQNLAMVGEYAEAERLFRNLLRRGNHLGLFAEEIDPATGAHLGNFPQALSHAALINTAHILELLRPREAPGAAAPAASA
ncbi:MAG: glycoside hydrolase family 15 protein [Gemmatimonadetes bacterium]|nr:glycoside hydrolase family 15 protein [Gemmatimonadota bacterium]